VPPPPDGEVRWDVPTGASLAELAHAPLPTALRAAPPHRTLHRDLYLDTADDALRERGVVCRLRLGADGRQRLILRVGGTEGAALRVSAAVRTVDPRVAVVGGNAVARRLHGVVDPSRLEVRTDIEVERWARALLPGWLGRPRLVLHYDRATARRGERAGTFQQLCAHRLRGSGDELARLAEAVGEVYGLTPTAGDARDRAELLLKWGAPPRAATNGAAARAAAVPGDAEFLNPELSLLAFQERVLSLAEDARTPLRERLRFLAIVGANLDEFYMVRVAGLRAAALEPTEEQTEDGLTPAERLAAIGARVAALTARGAACVEACVAALAAHGTRLRRWDELDAGAHAALRAYFRDSVLPELTPMAMTLSPGHPLPHFPHLSLSLAVVLRGPGAHPPRFASLELPAAVPRFVGVPGAPAGEVIALEALVRANLDVLYPGARVEHAHLFRITRGGDLGVEEAQGGSLLDAVAAATRRRPHNPVVRVEIEREMPAAVRHAVLEDLRRERSPDEPELGVDDLQETDGLLDLAAADALPVVDDAALEYPRFRGARAVPRERALFEVLRERDLLVHHPFERFSTTVVRLFEEAAADPDVVAVKAVLYRLGDVSPVAAALVEAARRGKRVAAFVELKARFDEDRNVGWARAIEEAGGRVVYGLVGVKTHAKAALVVRREGGALRSYVHVGTGNYNARSARHYTDLSLLSADEALAADVAELFNALTGSSRPPQRLSRGALVAPHQMLPALLAQIACEAAHARAGRPAGITLKVNGLSDAEVVRALCRASRDGVPVDLVVRGVCTLRPGVPGMSEGVRVVSVVGRLLEHSRVYRFANGGEPRYYIGSADLRPRNLRRRVELLVPVRDPACQGALDELLALYLRDPTAWELTATGAYRRRDWGGAGAQETLMRGGAAARGEAPT
jgi:polyphosphate kinase